MKDNNTHNLLKTYEEVQVAKQMLDEQARLHEYVAVGLLVYLLVIYGIMKIFTTNKNNNNEQI